MAWKEYYGEEILLVELDELSWLKEMNESKMTEVVNLGYENCQKQDGKIQVLAAADTTVRMGSYVIMSGSLDYYDSATNPGEFDTYKFYKNRGYLYRIKNGKLCASGEEYSFIKQRMYEIKLICAGCLDENLGEEDASILKAMLLGMKGDLDSSIKDVFQKNGIGHILAISGLHISFLCMGIYNLLRRLRLPIPICVLISGIFLFLYVAMVGDSASAVRAAVMFMTFLVAKLLHRAYDLMSAMSLASILILCGNPGYLFDASYQLSFLAVCAVGGFYKAFEDNIFDMKKVKKRVMRKVAGRLNPVLISLLKGMLTLGQNALVSAFVFVVTMPSILWFYYEIPFYSVLLNLLVIPLMSVLLVMGIAVILLTLTVKELAFIPAFFAKLILWIYKSTCVILENSAVGRRNLGRPDMWKIILFYIILLVVCNYSKKLKIPIFITGVTICFLLMSVRFHTGLELYVLDVGQGDGIITVNEKGRVYMFDGGSSSVSSVGDRRIIPALKCIGTSEIEGIFLSHPDEDHINGIRELLTLGREECIHVKRIYVGSGFLSNGDFEDIQELVEAQGGEICPISAGFTLGDGNMSVECLYPYEDTDISDANDASLVLDLDYGDFSFWEMGDLEKGGEKLMLDNMEGTPSAAGLSLLKVGHHGSYTSTSEELLKLIKPDMAVISVGVNNRYGHPHAETLEILKEKSIPYLRTDEKGCLHFKVGGGKVKIYSFVK